LRRFTSQLADFELQIRHEALIQTFHLRGSSISSSLDVPKSALDQFGLSTGRIPMKTLSLGGICGAMRL